MNNLLFILSDFIRRFKLMILGYSGSSELSLDQELHEKAQESSRQDLDELIKKFDRDLESLSTTCEVEQKELDKDLDNFEERLCSI